MWCVTCVVEYIRMLIYYFRCDTVQEYLCRHQNQLSTIMQLHNLSLEKKYELAECVKY